MNRFALAILLACAAVPAAAQIVQTPAAPADPGAGYIANSHYLPYGPQQIVTGGAQSAGGTMVCFVGSVKSQLTIDQLSVNYTVAPSPADSWGGVYGNAGDRPGALLAYTSAAWTAATGVQTAALAASYQLQANTPYWFCSLIGDTTQVAYGVAGAWTPQTAGAATGNLASLLGISMSGITCAGTACTGSSLTNAALNTQAASLSGATWTPVGSQGRVPALAFHVLSTP